jgi:phosphoribosyl 1,2-cyclic phosphodiesterase
VRIKFWGVRGSIPVPGKETIEFGGNTTCIELLTADNIRIILDAGTGIRALGLELMKHEFAHGKGLAHIFFTHSHWDHIQGFPFFAPAYIGKRTETGKKIIEESNRFFLYGAAEVGERLEETLRGQMSNCYFPVDLGYLSAHIEFKNLSDHKITLGNTTLEAFKLTHPNGVLGYRISDNKSSFVLATDCEHPSDGTIDQNLLKMAQNVDILIYDGQYTPEEYSPHKFNLEGTGRQGFGHSTPEEGVRAAKAVEAKRLIITHHDPLHNDEFLRNKEAEIRKLFKNSEFAREGQEIEI